MTLYLVIFLIGISVGILICYLTLQTENKKHTAEIHELYRKFLHNYAEITDQQYAYLQERVLNTIGTLMGTTQNILNFLEQEHKGDN